MKKLWRKMPEWLRVVLPAGSLLLLLWVGYDIYGRVRWAQFVERYSYPGSLLDYDAIRREREEAVSETGIEPVDFLNTPSMQKWNARNSAYDERFVNKLTEWPEGVSVPEWERFLEDFDWRSGRLEPLGRYLLGSKQGPPLDDARAAERLDSTFANFDEALSELIEDTKVPGQPSLGEIPSIGRINHFTKLLSFRVRVSLANQDGEKALEQLLCGLRFSERIREERTLVGFMVQIAVGGILEDVVWDGIQSGQWDDTQLSSLSEALGELRIASGYSESMLGAVGMVLFSIHDIERTPEGWRKVSLLQAKRSLTPFHLFDLQQHDWRGFFTNVMEAVLPRGHRYNELTRYGEYIEYYGMQPPDASGHFRDLQADNCKVLPRKPRFWTDALATPNMGRIVDSTLALQQFVDLARIACEVERFRLANGHYPANLDELPSDIPLAQRRDRFQPELMVRYERTADEKRYRLIASGSDRKDDRGNRETDDVFSTPVAAGIFEN